MHAKDSNGDAKAIAIPQASPKIAKLKLLVTSVTSIFAFSYNVFKKPNFSGLFKVDIVWLKGIPVMCVGDFVICTLKLFQLTLVVKSICNHVFPLHQLSCILKPPTYNDSENEYVLFVKEHVNAKTGNCQMTKFWTV